MYKRKFYLQDEKQSSEGANTLDNSTAEVHQNEPPADYYFLVEAINSCKDVFPFLKQRNSCILSDTAQLPPITVKAEELGTHV